MLSALAKALASWSVDGLFIGCPIEGVTVDVQREASVNAWPILSWIVFRGTGSESMRLTLKCLKA
jgi:hypothetical protein